MSSEANALPTRKSIIEVNDLGKCYRIYDSPTARLKQAIRRGKKQYYREFWALRNASFEVRQGESLGIIGRNGSGKSTLLQLVCGTLTPTEGKISSQGRIAALLELGSGFNPEFTGLENIYLNASLLGLTKEETESRLEEILAFADIGDFIEQPVKAYSSGMIVRLAFAVIAHVNADILVVDEALAVGDAIFVQRCMRFIRRVREERCLLFVSHDTEAVKSLCSHALWLSEGSVKAFGHCKTIALDYLRYCYATSSKEEIIVTGKIDQEMAREEAIVDVLPPDLGKHVYDYGTIGAYSGRLGESSGWKTGNAELTEASIKAVNSDEKTQVFRGGEEVIITIRALAHKALSQPILGFAVKNNLGQTLFGENTLVTRTRDDPRVVNVGEEIEAIFRLWFPMLPNGEYALTAAIADGDDITHVQHHWAEDAAIIRVSSSSVRSGLTGAFITDVGFHIVQD
jgi:lipopolysaccharide transport system ATP-binding protein